MAITPDNDQPRQFIEEPDRLLGTRSLQKWRVIELALGRRSKTARLCLILIVLGISPAITYGVGFVLWLMVHAR